MMKHNSTPTDLAEIVFNKLSGAKTNIKPSLNILIKLFEALFYTSLKTEESQHIKVTVTLIDSQNPDPYRPRRIVADRWKYTHFDKPIPFNTKELVKLSKAADPWSSSLAVNFDTEENLQIWGMIDQAVHYQSFLNYESESGPEQPGSFQSTITGIGSLVVIFDYELLATLKQNVLISNFIDIFNVGPISSFLKQNNESRIERIENHFDDYFEYSDLDWSRYIQTIVNDTISRLILSVQNYKHGGAILITNDINSDLNIKHKMEYDRLSNALDNLMKLTIESYILSNEIFELIENGRKTIPADIYMKESIAESNKRETRDELKGAIRFISSLTCIDGLVVLNTELKVRGFGAVIEFKEIPPKILISPTPSIRNGKFIEANPNQFGTRHRSMFSYCWNNPGSVGFVISQDGDIRAIYRVNEKLIMWENIKVQRFLKSDKLKRLLKKRK